MSRLLNRIVSESLPLCEVVDSVDNYSYFPSAYYPPLLDSWECKLEILKLDFDRFDFCTRPDDFVFTLNGIVAACTYSGTLPQPLIQWQSTNAIDHFQVRIRTVYPDPITDIDKPHLVIDLIATAYPLVDPITPDGSAIVRGLIDNNINIVITDTIADGMEWFNFGLDISADNLRVAVSVNNPKLIKPSFLQGDYFDLVVV
jgi:hypothetical protein